jgi:hypothetical protein
VTHPLANIGKVIPLLEFAERVRPEHRKSPERLKPALKNKLVIAAVNRCATQKQIQNRVFSSLLSPYAELPLLIRA